MTPISSYDSAEKTDYSTLFFFPCFVFWFLLHFWEFSPVYPRPLALSAPPSWSHSFPSSPAYLTADSWCATTPAPPSLAAPATSLHSASSRPWSSSPPSGCYYRRGLGVIHVFAYAPLHFAFYSEDVLPHLFALSIVGRIMMSSPASSPCSSNFIFSSCSPPPCR